MESKNKTNKQEKNTQDSYIQKKTLVVTKGWGKRGMTGDEVGGSWSINLQI